MLGERIRALRKSQNLKLNDIAQMSDLSVSYISQLERNLVEPSLSSLKKIAGALKTPIYLLVDESESEDIVVKKSERTTMTFPNSDTKFEIVSIMSNKLSFSPKMMMVEFFLPPNSEDSDEYVIHSEEEIILVTEGVVELMYGDEIYNLEEGDCAYVRENIPHRIINRTSTNVRGYYVVSPPNMPSKHK